VLWSGVFPSLFVMLTLGALLIAPAFFLRHTNVTWVEIADVAEPARARLLDAKRALAREMAAARAYALTQHSYDLLR
jgi:hypothetical protein